MMIIKTDDVNLLLLQYMCTWQFDLLDKGSDVSVWCFWFKNCLKAQVPKCLVIQKMALKVVLLDVYQKIWPMILRAMAN